MTSTVSLAVHIGNDHQQKRQVYILDHNQMRHMLWELSTVGCYIKRFGRSEICIAFAH